MLNPKTRVELEKGEGDDIVIVVIVAVIVKMNGYQLERLVW